MFAIPVLLLARERTQSEALSIATDFFNESTLLITRSSATPQLVATSSDIIYPNSTRVSITQQPAFYIFNYGDDAFVLVSGDDRMKPILGYSDKGTFTVENLPANIRSFLSSYVYEMAALDDKASTIQKTSKITTRTTFPTTVSPLLGDIMYNQSAPYNDLCPSSSVTGCVATAMSQVMRYHKYPTTGSGSNSYTTSTEGYSCSFDYAKIGRAHV